MEKQPITFIINGKTFRVRPDSLEALRAIPSADRKELIELLEAVKQQDRLSGAAVDRAAAIARAASPVAPAAPAAATLTAAPAASPTAIPTPPPQQATAKPEKLGKGDIDDLMKRLIMEERSKQKPPLKPQTLYFWLGGFTLIFLLLVMAL